MLFSVSLTNHQGTGLVNTTGLQLVPMIVEGKGISTRLGGTCSGDEVDPDTGQGLCSAWFPADRFPKPGEGPSIVYVTIEAQV